ncbi:MAG: hypothetical protein HKO65_02435 [Gemmatimonadetes bacterium]|nr:hypothetical protein [Gemmatimonadota bacterium]
MRAAAVLAVLLLFACDDDGIRPPIDPIITDLTAEPLIVATGEQSTITAVGYDREQHPLTYSWEATGGSLAGAGDSVVWTAPEVEGTYAIFLTILDEEGGTDTDSVLVDVRNGTLLINTGGGLIAYGFDGDHFGITEGRSLSGTDLLKGDDIEVFGTRIYLSGIKEEYRILEVGYDGRLLSSTSPIRPDIYAAGFTVLPDGGFAVLDNYSDSVHILDQDGFPRATVPIPDPLPGLLGRQIVDGLVVGNRLIVSETGRGKIFSVDLTTYETFVFFEFFETESWLGAIAWDGGEVFHVYMNHDGVGKVFAFAETGEPQKVCTLPETNAFGLASVGSYLFATVNRAGTVYRINRFTRKVEKILDGLDWPTDIEYLPVGLEKG